jgi:hypothetical protein
MEITTCPQCNTSNPANFRYCKNCGHELPKTEPAVQAEALPEKPVPKSGAAWSKWIGFAVGIMVMLTVKYYFFSMPSYDKALAAAASELNKTCPMMVDKDTRFDNAIALPNNVFQYNYTLVNATKDMVDTMQAQSILEPIMINYVRSNPEMSIQREHKTTLSYYYKDKEGVYLFSIIISPEKYL